MNSPNVFRAPFVALAVLAGCSSPEGDVQNAEEQVVAAQDSFNNCVIAYGHPSRCTVSADRLARAESNLENAERSYAENQYYHARARAVDHCAAKGVFEGANMATVATKSDEELIATGCVENAEELLRLREEASIE